MAKISLRSYTREIENMIERGQTAEAIGHCKHILKTFPKHLETYRLLGKAFLESQRYTEAADVLERVLAAIPDDYIAHLGMSIIREDEGNLDAAIWHMERVFEVQPANTAFQTELRRLYGRRDGIEPPKIRLTRGALVRMYAKGDLFPQATAEIRAALAEDPKRVDLEAILASVYYQAGRKVEATEICSRLVAKAPFNYEANRILADILPATSRAEDARIYQSRLQAMDPYAAYISSDSPLSADVSDDAVLIERIDWLPPTETENQPAWAQSIGLAWDETPPQTEPDWMNVAKESDATPLASSHFQPTEHPQTVNQPENQLPDFLSGAGWTTSSEDLTAVPDTQIYADEQTPSESPSGDELAEADIPDWLAAMAPPTVQETTIEDSSRSEWLANILPPQESDSPVIEPDQTVTGSDTDWLAGLGAVNVPEDAQKLTDDSTPEWLSALGADTSAETAQPAEAATPDWLAALGAETPAEAKPVQPSEESTPEWLAALGSETAAEAEPAQPAEEATPDWLAALGAETLAEAKPVQPSEEATPEWLAALGAETPAEAEPVQASDEATPEWLAALGAETPAETEPAQASEETTPDWLAALGAETPSETEPVQASDEATPEWLAALGAETPAETEPVQPSEEATPEWLAALGAETPAEAEPVQASDEATPEWLAALGAETPAEAEPVQPSEEATPEWLAALGAETSAEAEPAQAVDEATPEWLSELITEEPQTSITPLKEIESEIIGPQAIESMFDSDLPAPIEPMPEPTLESTLPPSNTDIDSALAWLESLAVKQGADEDFLLVPADQRTTEAPEWLSPEPKADSLPSTNELTEAVSQSVDIIPSEEMAAEIIRTENEQKEALPEWLSGLENTGEESILAVETSVPGWAATADTEQPVQAQTELELPISLKEALPETEPAEPVVEITQPTAINTQPTAHFESTQPEVDMDAALAWLEGLAVKQGADSDFLFTTEDERGALPPDWVNEQVEESIAEIPETSFVEESNLADQVEGSAVISEANIEAIIPEVTDKDATREIYAEPSIHVIDIEAALPETEEEALARTADIEEIVPEIMPAQENEMIDLVLDEIQPVEASTTPATEADIDSALAWLEGLAAKQGADSDFLFVAEGDRTEKPPEWVEDEIATASMVEELPKVDQTTAELPAATQPSDLAEAMQDTSAPSLEPSILGDEVTGVIESILTQEMPTEQQLDVPELEEAVEVLADQQPAPEIPVAEIRMPDWLQSPQEPAQPEVEAESVEAWLSTLTDETPEPASKNVEAVEWKLEEEPAPAQPAEPIPQLSELEITDNPDAALETAEKAMYAGQIEQGLEIYNALIEQNSHLEETIHGLREALYRHPIDISIWQSLGDAYAHNNSLQEALDAYTKAEELLR